jgi:hypothetical protein
MAENKHIRCADCRYVRLDKAASDYSQKRCKGCEFNIKCTCRKKVCICGKGCKYRKTDDVCPKQELKWAAYECGCFDSEYFKALLNVGINGHRMKRVAWSGCEYGERRDG